MRLQKYIAQAGIASRRKAEELITSGCVEVNGKVVAKLGTKVDPDKDRVSVNNKVITFEQKIYIILNKPAGYICTLEDRHAKRKVVDIIDKKFGRLYTVGRLDKDTEGLIILTNDGDFANKITHPSQKIPKTYVVECKGKITPAKLAILQKGVDLEDGLTSPAEVKLLSSENNKNKLEIIISEGRKRQVRRMLGALGCEVKYLQRIKIGNLELGNLEVGRYRELSREDLGLVLPK